MIELGAIIDAGILLVSGGAAWGGAKAALNGTKAKVKDISEKLDAHVKDDSEVQTQVVDRLARIET